MALRNEAKGGYWLSRASSDTGSQLRCPKDVAGLLKEFDDGGRVRNKEDASYKKQTAINHGRCS